MLLLAFTLPYGCGGSGGLTGTGGHSVSGNGGGSGGRTEGNPIQHIVIIMQENRSFDHYFGTYPGADGIPFDQNGVPTVGCKTALGKLIRPFHDSNDINSGGSHSYQAAVGCIDG